jgi:nucleoside-diphosphate-sugar epimerase
MRIFVTGGTGFIGSRVVKELQRKHSVHILSSRLDKLQKIKKELESFKPEVVIHLAWEGLPDISPKLSNKNKRDGERFFKLVSTLNVPKLIATGTAWEYETAQELKRHKHDSFINAKRALRSLGLKIMRKNGGTFVWVIPFFVYGTGKKAGSLLPSLIAQAQAGQAPTPKNPDAWHDFVYVDDVAHAIALLATKKISSGSYDIGSGTLTRTGVIARKIAKEFKLPPIKLGQAVEKGLCANIVPLRKATGWKPKFSISKGVKAMIK